MSRPTSRPIRNSVIATLVATGVVSLIKFLVPGSWSWVIDQLYSLWTYLNGPIGIPIWFFATLCIFSAGLIVILIMSSRGNTKSKIEILLSYTEDIFFGIQWRWQYTSKGAIHNICAFCPKCDFQMCPELVSLYDAVPEIKYYCEECDEHFGNFCCTLEEVEPKVRRKIQHVLRQQMANQRELQNA
jgi:hypothetical protein